MGIGEEGGFWLLGGGRRRVEINRDYYVEGIGELAVIIKVEVSFWRYLRISYGVLEYGFCEVGVRSVGIIWIKS